MFTLLVASSRIQRIVIPASRRIRVAPLHSSIRNRTAFHSPVHTFCHQLPHRRRHAAIHTCRAHNDSVYHHVPISYIGGRQLQHTIAETSCEHHHVAVPRLDAHHLHF